MPALSYKERFCPFVKDYSKTQSIRAFRKRPFKAGDTLMHYYGMRTKHCTKLIPDNTCSEVKTIWIFKNGNVYLGPVMTEREAKRLLRAGEMIIAGIGKKLTRGQKDQLAYDDGFRFPDSMQCYFANQCFKIMFYWWNETHSLPFTGQLIKWNAPNS